MTFENSADLEVLPKIKKLEENLNGYYQNGNLVENKFLNRKFVLNCFVNEWEKKIRSKDGDNQLEMKKINKIIENAIHWCLVNGFVLVPKQRQQSDLMVVTYLPFTLFPTPFKKSHFEQVYYLQPKINNLVDKISYSTDLMEKAFESLNGMDSFLNSLWLVYKQALETGYNQKIKFSILRCDYMLHQPDLKSDQIYMKQVEINTIAAGFGYVSTKASKLHREILKWCKKDEFLDKLPINEPVVKMAKGFAEAWRLYNVKNSIVLFIVLDVEINIADQRHLEYEIINQESAIEIHRCTLTDLSQYGRLDDNKTLFYNDQEVAIVYYRAGYDPSHYKSQQEWDVLLKIESSKAIKCPSLGTFLAGMKKIQETIADEDNLKQLCNSDLNLVESFKSVFAQFFLLNNQKNIDTVLRNPENYVLKPQREGGGHNFYNQEIVDLLEKIENIENKQAVNGESKTNGHGGILINEDIYKKDLYIVMEYLRPVITDNYIISSQCQQKLHQTGRAGTLEKINITNELGIYGVLVKNGEETVLNETCGYCLRSKPAEDNEAGVMCGSGALDSILLID